MLKYRGSMDKSQTWTSVSYLVLSVNGFTGERGKERVAQCHSSKAIPAAVLRLPADTTRVTTPASLTACQEFLGSIIHCLWIQPTPHSCHGWGRPPAVKALPQLSHLNHSWGSVWGTPLPKSKYMKVHFGVNHFFKKEYFLFSSQLSHMTIVKRVYHRFNFMDEETSAKKGYLEKDWLHITQVGSCGFSNFCHIILSIKIPPYIFTFTFS